MNIQMNPREKTMNWRTTTATLGALLLVASGGVALAIPTTLTVQGHLTNAAGQAADGEYVLRLSIHDAPAGGNTVWTQLYEVDVVDGVFDCVFVFEAFVLTEVEISEADHHSDGVGCFD